MPEQQRAAKDRQQHLYLLFDDWHSGYSIRKVTLSRRSGKRAQPLPSDPGEGADEPLPGAFMRMEAPRGFPEFFTSAFGAKIMVTHPGAGMAGIKRVPMVDVQEHSFVFGPPQNSNVFPIHFPVGDKELFILDIGTLDCFSWMPEHSEQWVWRSLPCPPFERADVSSYGVQPDGCILVSTICGATFIFDANKYVWEQYSSWALPFTGRGHYDMSLKGFVGLSKEGYLYLYCSTSLRHSPDFKRSKETVYSKNPAERHVSATLLHMRPGTFCLVECVSIDIGRAEELRETQDDQELREPEDDQWAPVTQCGRGFMYRLKTFSLGYDTKRDLKIKHCQVEQCYTVPHEATTNFITQDPLAFWL